MRCALWGFSILGEALKSSRNVLELTKQITPPSQKGKNKRPLRTPYTEASHSLTKTTDLDFDILDARNLRIQHHMELAIRDIEDARSHTINQEVVVG